MSPPDNTVAQRVRQQRDVRLNEGWEEVRVWVPTKGDADDLRKIAAERRAKAESLNELTGSEINMAPEQLEQIRAAIAEQGSPAYNTPSGPVLTLLTELATAGDLVGLSRAFVLFARAKPANAAFVSGHIPGKIVNGYFLRYLQLNVAQVMTWEREHPQFGEEIQMAVRDEQRFQTLVKNMAASIRRRSIGTGKNQDPRDPE